MIDDDLIEGNRDKWCIKVNKVSLSGGVVENSKEF